MVFRKRYWLYYFLTFMAGARRQIFIAFSVLLLVQKFGYSVQAVTVLFVINNAINFFLSPTIGRAIIRFGERKVLTLEYASLIVVFLAYATTDSKWVAGGLYILDHIFFNFGMAINTFFQKMGDPGDVAPTMAVGFTINHIAAVFLPALGGFPMDYRLSYPLCRRCRHGGDILDCRPADPHSAEFPTHEWFTLEPPGKLNFLT
jgi:predicted MFS family arabinose efflux permease